jgi:hypothetical protein
VRNRGCGFRLANSPWQTIEQTNMAAAYPAMLWGRERLLLSLAASQATPKSAAAASGR